MEGYLPEEEWVQSLKKYIYFKCIMSSGEQALWYLSMLFLFQSNGNLGKVTIPDITVEYQWRHEKEKGGGEIQ